MSASTTATASRHEPREFVVTTFSKKPAGKNAPSRDILWSEVWDTESPLALGHPFRWVLQKHGEKVRIRDLGTGTARVITRPIDEIPLDELSSRGAIELSTGDSRKRCWVLIQPVKDLRQIATQVAAGGYCPKTIQPVAVSDVVANKFFKKTSLGVSVTMLLAWLVILLLPKPAPKPDELIPEQFAKVLLSPALKASAGGAAAASGKRGGVTNVVQAFQSATVQRTTKTLLSAGAARALLSGSTLLNTAASSVAARKVLDSKSALNAVGIPGAQNLEAKSADVGLLGGRGGGRGPGAGVSGYGAGGGASVAGQGTGLVSVGNDGVGVSEGLTKDEVGKVIREHMAEVRYCYDSALLRSPGLEGKLLLSFVVKSYGGAVGAKVKESSGDRGLDDCIVSRLVKWKFPKPRGGVDVGISYPFIFKSLGN